MSGYLIINVRQGRAYPDCRNFVEVFEKTRTCTVEWGVSVYSLIHAFFRKRALFGKVGPLVDWLDKYRTFDTVFSLRRPAPRVQHGVHPACCVIRGEIVPVISNY